MYIPVEGDKHSVTLWEIALSMLVSKQISTGVVGNVVTYIVSINWLQLPSSKIITSISSLQSAVSVTVTM